MSAIAENVVRFQFDASTFAFDAGQLLESLLWERGLDRARNTDADVVTLQLIRTCVDDGLFEELRKRLHEQLQREPRKAA